MFVAEDENCINFFLGLVDWGQYSSMLLLSVLMGFTGSDVCVSCAPLVNGIVVEVSLKWLVGRRWVEMWMCPVPWLPSHRAPIVLWLSSCFRLWVALFALAGVSLLGLL